MSYRSNSIPNVRTIKAQRGESLKIDLGKTFEGILTAWMKRDPNDLEYREFEVQDGRYLYLSKEKASDYYDEINPTELVSAIAGKWFFDVEQEIEGEDTRTIYRGTILFQNDITGSAGSEGVPVPLSLFSDYKFNGSPGIDPNQGYLSFDAATYEDTATIKINKLNLNGLDLSDFISQLTVGAAIELYDTNYPTQSVVFQVASEYSLNGNIYSIPVNFRSSTGEIFINGHYLSSLFMSPGEAFRKENTSTGIVWGGTLTINPLDNSKFDIEAGEAHFINAYSDQANPTYRIAVWEKQESVTIENLATEPVTFISMEYDGNGGVIFNQDSDLISSSETRDKVQIGVIVHENNTSISKVGSLSNWSADVDLKINDIFNAFGTTSVSGNRFFSNGGLKISRTEGVSLSLNHNRVNDTKTPNYLTSEAEDDLTFLAVKGGSTLTPTNDIDTSYYDPGGLGVLVPIPTGYCTTHGIFYSPTTGLTFVHYGQFLYDSLKKAVQSWQFEDYNVVPQLREVALMGVLAFEAGATDLSNQEQAKFIKPTMLGIKGVSPVTEYSRYGESVELINGLSYDKQNTTLLSTGGVIYVDVERLGGGDMIYVFGQREYVLDCRTGAGVDGKARVALTAGASSKAPVDNYVYVIRSGDVAILQSSTTRPTGQFAYIGNYLVPDATTFLTTGAYKSQEFTDAKSFDGRSAVQRSSERLRVLPAEFEEGMLQTVTVTTLPDPDSVDFEFTSGKAWQKHLQNTPALKVSVDGIYIINHPTDPYIKINNLNDPEALQTASGESLSGRWFNWVIWVAVNKTTDECKLYLALPNGSYGSDADAIADPNNTAVTTIPKSFRGVGLLNARLPFRHRTLNNGTYTNLAASVLGQQVIDLRGKVANVGAGGGLIPASTVFANDTFRIYDYLNLYQMGFNLSSLTADRTYTMQDKSGTLAHLADLGIQNYTPLTNANNGLILTSGKSYTFNAIAAFAVSMPAAPTTGVRFRAYFDSTATFSVTFNGNGKNIEGSSTFIAGADANGGVYEFVYNALAGEWKVINLVGGGGGAAEREIVAPTSWDGSQYNLPLDGKQYTKTVNNAVTTLIVGLDFQDDSATVSRTTYLVIDNSGNSSAIESISYIGGTWAWSVGDPINSIAAGAIVEIEVRNRSNTLVKALTDVED